MAVYKRIKFEGPSKTDTFEIEVSEDQGNTWNKLAELWNKPRVISKVYDNPVPIESGLKIYTKNRILKAMDSDGIEFDLNKENINLVWKWRGNNDWYQPINYNNKETDCNHNWVTTVGFSSEYIDCSKCGAKKEEV